MGQLATRIGLGVGTLGLSEGGGLREAVPAGLGALMPTPAVPTSPPAATTKSKAVQEAASEAARRRQRARGFRSTILSQDFGAGAVRETLGG